MPYYAVVNGKIPGIYGTWDECKEQIYKFPNAKFKKFMTSKDANNYLNPSLEVESSSTIIPLSSGDFKPDYYIYTDGCCINNGQVNSKAGIGIYFGKDDNRNVSREIIGKKTNNIAELTAIIETYNIILDDIIANKKIMIMTDSMYCINCIGDYGKRMEKEKWKKNIPNKDLVKQIYKMYNKQVNVKFKHIRAHTNKTDIHSMGNHWADYLANKSVGLTECPYQNTIQLSANNRTIINKASSDRTYLKVPFRKKNDVKSHGALWDFDKKQWYIMNDNENRMKLMSKYLR